MNAIVIVFFVVLVAVYVVLLTIRHWQALTAIEYAVEICLTENYVKEYQKDGSPILNHHRLKSKSHSDLVVAFIKFTRKVHGRYFNWRVNSGS